MQGEKCNGILMDQSATNVINCTFSSKTASMLGGDYTACALSMAKRQVIPCCWTVILDLVIDECREKRAGVCLWISQRRIL